MPMGVAGPGQVGDRHAGHGAERAADHCPADRMGGDAANHRAGAAAEQGAVGFTVGQATTGDRQGDNARE
jgi:hypothetical protein